MAYHVLENVIAFNVVILGPEDNRRIVLWHGAGVSKQAAELGAVALQGTEGVALPSDGFHAPRGLLLPCAPTAICLEALQDAYTCNGAGPLFIEFKNDRPYVLQAAAALVLAA
ncbi:MAG: hypothetical protein AB7G06_07835 [Bdellovibrionales bacterium]